MSQPFTLGVNYWPRRKAMYWWSQYDAGEVREEFSLIRDLGLRMVRIFLLWDDFQPTPDQADPQRVRDLVTTADIAAELGLGLNITFFTGHMSGPNWSPRWLLSGHPPVHRIGQPVVSMGRVVAEGFRNPYTDPIALSAERVLLRTVTGALKDHPGVHNWNLGNEPDLFAEPPTYQLGRKWVRDCIRVIREAGAQQPVTCGLHTDSLFGHNGFRVNEVFAETDFGVMHAYPMYIDWVAEHDPLDPDWVPFSVALTRQLSGKPIYMEEFGGCSAPEGQPTQQWTWDHYFGPYSVQMTSEEDLAEYYARVLPRLVKVGAQGAVAWCFADYAESLWDRPPCNTAKHEIYFGLVRPNGTLKPHAEVLRQFAATQPQVLAEPTRTAGLDVTPEVFYQDPLGHTQRLFRQYKR